MNKNPMTISSLVSASGHKIFTREFEDILELRELRVSSQVESANFSILEVVALRRMVERYNECTVQARVAATK